LITKKKSVSRKGTLLFFSPELFLLSSYINEQKVDIWAFGVLIFLMIYGYFPFFELTYNKLKYKVLYSSPNYPENISIEEKNFFNEIFIKDPLNRITLDKIKNHPFVNNLK
jgi:5'-AMP-activated protein kinase catalytic alpha subunit